MGWFGRKRSETIEDRSLRRPTTWPEYPSYYPTYGIGDIGPQDALRIADVLACVRVLADTAASLPLVAYRRLPDGSRERFSGRITDLIARPAPGNTTANLIGTIVSHLNLHGNAFVGKFRDADGIVAQLAALDPAAVNVSLSAGEPVYLYQDPTGANPSGVPLGTADILHIKALSVDGIVGISPIGQARQALGLAQNLAAHADSFAKNAGRPGGVLRVSGWRSAQPGAAEDIRSDWEGTFQGQANAGRLLVLTGEGDVQYQALSLSMADAEFVAQRQLSTQEIARVFQVPPWMIGAAVQESMTYANAEWQALSFAKFSLTPWLVVIEQAFAGDPDLSPSTVFVEFLLDALLRPDSATRAGFYAQALNPTTGWMSRAEVRRLENLPDETPEDVPTAPAPVVVVPTAPPAEAVPTNGGSSA